jgi:hypothetical protein
MLWCGYTESTRLMSRGGVVASAGRRGHDLAANEQDRELGRRRR